MNDETILQKAIHLINSGERKKGQQILIQLAKKDPNNERAWLCLVKTTEKCEQKMQLVEKALAIDPDNKIAKKLYAKFHHEHALQSGTDTVILEPKVKSRSRKSAETNLGQCVEQNDLDFLDSGYVHVEFDPEYISPQSVSGDASKALEDGFEVHLHDSEDSKPDYYSLTEMSSVDSDQQMEAGRVDLGDDFLDSGYDEGTLDFLSSEKGASIEVDLWDDANGRLSQAPTFPKSDPSGNRFSTPGSTARHNAYDIEDLMRTPVDMKIPEKVFQFDASMVLTKGRSAIGRIFGFGVVENSSKLRIKVAPEVELVHIQGIDALVQHERHTFHFRNIKAIESHASGFLTIYLLNGKVLKLKEMHTHQEFLQLLPASIPVHMYPPPSQTGDAPPLFPRLG